MLGSIATELQTAANEEKAVFLRKYFKTGPGEYGEGDVFIGLTVPQMRATAKKYWQLPFGDVEDLLRSPIHEYRVTALMILVEKYEKDAELRKKTVDFYLAHTQYINNWDLVDGSAPYILGEYLQDKSRKLLYTFAESKNLWERRIAIVATQAFIRKDQYADTFALAEKLMRDKHDLIHKATGWMLREVGKRNRTALEAFLTKHGAHMPRTALRYAIERFTPAKRKQYLAMGKKDAKPAKEVPHVKTNWLFERVKNR
jgi:3-methyladenine DNA glycosylase AlkD